jgi:hypothetical protein
LRELHNAQFFLPVVFTLQPSKKYIVIDHIGIFPSLCSADRRATIHQVVLAPSFCKYQGNSIISMVAKAEEITQLSIYLIDDSDIPSIYSLAKDMALTFPRIKWLNLCHKRGWETVSFLLTVTITASYPKGIFIILATSGA